MAGCVVVALLLAACGSGDGDDEAEPPTTPERTTEVPPDRDRDPDRGDGRGGVRLAELGEFEAPLDIVQPPGERDDLYVVEQGGRIERLSSGERAGTFLDISDQVTSGREQGLLSLAFAPDFRRSGRLYVYFTDTAGDVRLVEYRSDDGESADPESARELLRIEEPFENHNGGELAFGPDGLLYISVGDGGSGGDPQRNALDLGTLLGKLLRIDPRPSGGEPYSVPEDNPFVGESGARPEIYSLGLRNPFRFSFDRDTGALAIGDVGQNAFEEVDLVTEGEGAGASFGWSAFEGNERFNSDQEAPDAVPPVLVYPLEGGNCAVTGGYVVRDPELPSLFGRYLYADFCVGELRSFTARPGRPARDDRALGIQVPSLSSFGEDDRGQIYVTSLEGPVFRLRAE